MSDVKTDPLSEAPLAETYAAFAQLLRTAEEPIDEAALVASLAGQLDRRSRRWRGLQLRMGVCALAAAASLLVAAIVVFRASQGGTEVALAGPAVNTPSQNIDSPLESVAPTHIASEPLSGETGIVSAEGVLPWDDELADATAQLAEEVETTVHRWREQPDSFALLQMRTNELEREITSGTE